MSKVWYTILPDGIIVLRRNEGEERLAYTGADGRLHMTHGADRAHTISPEDANDLCLACSFYPVEYAYQPNGEIDWERTVPDLSRLTLSRLWAEGQERLP